jgi:zinc and cadmium transporter
MLSGLGSMLGGVLGYYFLASSSSVLPYFLVFSSASFLYVAVADLIPQMQQRLPAKELAQQLFFIGLGIGIIFVMTSLLH